MPSSEITDSFIGPTWGADVTRQSLWGLSIFLALTFLILALYFRTWKMSVAAIIGLVDVLVITIGVYAVFGFEISPAAVIGFLTILSYALYDTTVVFDKVRENTRDDGEISGRTFAESGQPRGEPDSDRSINTTVVAICPSARSCSSVCLSERGPSATISLSIFVGTIVAAYSTLFVAAGPCTPAARAREADRQRVQRVRARREEGRHPGLSAVEAHGTWCALDIPRRARFGRRGSVDLIDGHERGG